MTPLTGFGTNPNLFSPYLNYIGKDPISTQGYILRFWVLVNLGGTLEPLLLAQRGVLKLTQDRARTRTPCCLALPPVLLTPHQLFQFQALQYSQACKVLEKGP